jgi:1,2-diacylglycerol 3-beta-galactosyltransferase
MATASTAVKTKRVLLLMSTAGGGHKSAAESIREALTAKYGKKVIIQMVDVLKEYAPQPLDRMPEAYQMMIKSPATWKGVYDMTDGTRRSKMLNMSISLITRRHAERLLDEHPADVIVSTFHFANAPVLETLQRRKDTTPFITVITDLVTAPPVWFDKRNTLCIAPTQQVADLAIEYGLNPDIIKVIGMPVADRFVPPAQPKAELKAALGWDANKPAIIAMAGAEGIGSLGRIAAVLTTLDATIIVITGKNAALYKKLTLRTTAPNVKIYGFVKNMNELMQAADLIVTKAGPGTIMEALNSHLPLLLYSKLSGQEDGNVSFVTQNGAGLWQPRISSMARSIQVLLDNPRALPGMATAAADIAQTGANAKIAAAIGKQLELRA